MMFPLQSLGSAQKSSWSRDSSSSPLSHIEEDHVYRYPATVCHSLSSVTVFFTCSCYLQLSPSVSSVSQTNRSHPTRRQRPWPLPWAATYQSSTGCCWNSTPCNRAPLRSPLQVDTRPSTLSVLFVVRRTSCTVNVSTEETAPPLPSCSITHYENGSAPDIMVSPPTQEKPKRNGTRLDESRPTVESLLDELEGSVPSPRYRQPPNYSWSLT